MGRRSNRLPFRYLEPAFFGGLLDDPLLFLRIRPLRRALLFDCGQLAHLAKRVVKPIDAVFISHAHMDHIMGLPTLVRHHHASPRPLDIFGPPGIADRVEHLLHGYDWNLCEPTWFTLRVHEVHPERIDHVDFRGPAAFGRFAAGSKDRTSETIWTSRFVDVAARQFDHKIPVLAFLISEHPPFAVAPEKLKALGLNPGDWINDLKSRVWRGRTEQQVAPVSLGAETATESHDPESLYRAICAERPEARIGYLTDVGFTTENLAGIETFLTDLTLLCAENSFLAADRDKARASYHLCTSDLNTLTDRLTPRYLLAMHLSKSYLRRYVDLYRELHPPSGTTVLPLPPHIVPPPLTVDDVSHWLQRRPEQVQNSSTAAGAQPPPTKERPR